MKVEFTQYLRPDGRKQTITMDVPDDLKEKIDFIIKNNHEFTCEVLTTGEVALYVSNNEEDIECLIVNNGPGMKEKVIELINNGFELLKNSEKTINSK